MAWRSSLWVRWLGWTTVFTVGLVVWGAFLTWPHNPLRAAGDEVGMWAVILVPAALAFGIGVLFADWWWVFGVFVVNVLVAAILIRVVAGEPPESGSAQVVAGIIYGFLFLLLPLTLLAAASGVRRGKRREAADLGARRVVPGVVLRVRAPTRAPPVSGPPDPCAIGARRQVVP
jgi:hypothetical protein